MIDRISTVQRPQVSPPSKGNKDDNINSSIDSEQPKTTADEKVRKYFQHWHRLAHTVSTHRNKVAEWPHQPIVTRTPGKQNISKMRPYIPEPILKHFANTDHQTFLKNLQKAWASALAAIGSESYKLLMTSTFNLSKSESWVTGLLLRHELSFRPIGPQLPNPDKHYIIVDDASYSGFQICGELSRIKSTMDKGSVIHLVIPYMSETSKTRIMNEFSSSEVSVVFMIRLKYKRLKICKLKVQKKAF